MTGRSRRSKQTDECFNTKAFQVFECTVAQIFITITVIGKWQTTAIPQNCNSEVENEEVSSKDERVLDRWALKVLLNLRLAHTWQLLAASLMTVRKPTASRTKPPSQLNTKSSQFVWVFLLRPYCQWCSTHETEWKEHWFRSPLCINRSKNMTIISLSFIKCFI